MFKKRLNHVLEHTIAESAALVIFGPSIERLLNGNPIEAVNSLARLGHIDR